MAGSSSMGPLDFFVEGRGGNYSEKGLSGVGAGGGTAPAWVQRVEISANTAMPFELNRVYSGQNDNYDRDYLNVRILNVEPLSCYSGRGTGSFVFTDIQDAGVPFFNVTGSYAFRCSLPVYELSGCFHLGKL